MRWSWCLKISRGAITYLPINFDKNSKVLTLAMADTFNVVALDQVAAILGSDVASGYVGRW